MKRKKKINKIKQVINYIVYSYQTLFILFAFNFVRLCSCFAIQIRKTCEKRADLDGMTKFYYLFPNYYLHLFFFY